MGPVLPGYAQDPLQTAVRYGILEDMTLHRLKVSKKDVRKFLRDLGEAVAYAEVMPYFYYLDVEGELLAPTNKTSEELIPKIGGPCHSFAHELCAFVGCTCECHAPKTSEEWCGPKCNLSCQNRNHVAPKTSGECCLECIRPEPTNYPSSYGHTWCGNSACPCHSVTAKEGESCEHGFISGCWQCSTSTQKKIEEIKVRIMRDEELFGIDVEARAKINELIRAYNKYNAKRS